MPEMHLRQPRFTYSAWGPFTKKQRMQKFKETGDLQDFKDLIRTTAADKILRDKALKYC